MASKKIKNNILLFFSFKKMFQKPQLLVLPEQNTPV